MIIIKVFEIHLLFSESTRFITKSGCDGRSSSIDRCARDFSIRWANKRPNLRIATSFLLLPATSHMPVRRLRFNRHSTIGEMRNCFIFLNSKLGNRYPRDALFPPNKLCLLCDKDLNEIHVLLQCQALVGAARHFGLMRED